VELVLALVPVLEWLIPPMVAVVAAAVAIKATAPLARDTNVVPVLTDGSTGTKILK
jgi:hypothetical protein